MPALLTVWLLCIVAFCWFVVFRTIPGYLQSRFRYEIWVMRDELADNILDGKYASKDAPVALLEEMETAIRAAAHLTMFRFCVVMRLGRDVDVPEENALDLSGVRTSDRRDLERFQERLYHRVTRHLFTGAPIGWVMYSA